MPRINISQRSKVHYPDPALAEFLGLGIHHRAYVQDKLQFPGRQAVPGFHELILLPDIGVRIRLLNPEQFQLHIVLHLFPWHLAMMTIKITKVNVMLDLLLQWRNEKERRRPVLPLSSFLFSLNTTLRFVLTEIWQPK